MDNSFLDNNHFWTASCC